MLYLKRNISHNLNRTISLSHNSKSPNTVRSACQVDPKNVQREWQIIVSHCMVKTPIVLQVEISKTPYDCKMFPLPKRLY